MTRDSSGCLCCDLDSLVARHDISGENQPLLLVQMTLMSRLPKRMAIHELQRKAAAAEATATTDKRDTRNTSSRSCVSPEKIGQVLSRRQQLWDQQLLAAKRTKKPVVPQV